MSVNKSEVIKKHQQDAKDTGSPEVQVALISARVTHLTEHLRTHRKDFHSRRGLIMLTNRRRKLLAYLRPYRTRFIIGLLCGAIYGALNGLLVPPAAR